MLVTMRKLLAVAIVLVWIVPPPAGAQPSSGAAVIFVHGMGTSADEIGTEQFADLLTAVARRHPAPGVCPDDAQPRRPWGDGSPCVFRYVEDAAETDDGPNDSQSAVQDNADKLATEVEEVASRSGRRVVLAGYSMGGAIIRTFLATHRAAAERDIAAVVLVDAVASGSWGYAFASALPRRFDDEAADDDLGDRLREMLRTVAASSASVDFSRPATTDLSPRSDHFRRIAPMPLPKNVSYYTFWGDIRVVIERRLLHYELPAYELPSLGDLGLLAGDPDPTVLPELGGQRFSPPTDDDQVALDVPHRARIVLDAGTVRELISRCGRPPSGDDDTGCADAAAGRFSVPNTHTAVPTNLARIDVDVPELGGETTLLDAMLAAIGRHA